MHPFDLVEITSHWAAIELSNGSGLCSRCLARRMAPCTSLPFDKTSVPGAAMNSVGVQEQGVAP
jgi:hypothetical protein